MRNQAGCLITLSGVVILCRFYSHIHHRHTALSASLSLDHISCHLASINSQSSCRSLPVAIHHNRRKPHRTSLDISRVLPQVPTESRALMPLHPFLQDIFGNKIKMFSVILVNIMLLAGIIVGALIVEGDLGSNKSSNSTSANQSPHHANVSNVTFSALLAPVHHNVSAGSAWVYPSSDHDIGAKDMSCECFDPERMFSPSTSLLKIRTLSDEQYECADSCCMPASSRIAPFCMPKGSTCCANTFCTPGETCCGDFCCPTVSILFPRLTRRALTYCGKDTTCNLKAVNSGCCPLGALCSGTLICYDHHSPNCTYTLTPKPECCPASLPYCHNIGHEGLGCYATSGVESQSPATINATFGISAAPTGKDVVASLLDLGINARTSSSVPGVPAAFSGGNGSVAGLGRGGMPTTSGVQPTISGNSTLMKGTKSTHSR